MPIARPSAFILGAALIACAPLGNTARAASPAAAPAAQAAQADDQASGQPRTLRLSRYGSKQHALQVEVAGKPRTMLFDTGEGTTMVSPQVARDAGCQPWGNEVGFRMLGERFEAPRCDDLAFDAAGHHALVRSVLVYDISRLTGPDAAPLDGAVGLDLFDQRVVTLDLARNEVVVENDASARVRTAAAAEVPLRVTRYANGGIDVFLGVRTPRGLAWMTMDSANAGPTVFVAPAIAPLLGLKPDVRTAQPVVLPLAEGVAVTGQARVFPDMIMDGNIGMQLLGAHVVTLDLKHDRAWVAAGPAARR